LSAEGGVLIVIETLGTGGAEWALVNLAPELKQRCGCLEVAVLHAPYTLEVELENQGIPVHRLDIHNPWHVWSGVRGLKRLFGTRRFSIVHGHLFFGALHASVAGTLSPDLARIASFHNLGYASYPPRTIAQHGRKWLERAVMGHLVDGCVAVSAAVAAHYSDQLGLRDVAVIPNALSQELVDSAKEPRPGPRGERTGSPLIVMPGRFVPEKGHDVLLRAACQLETEFPGLELVLAGSGPGEEEVRHEVERLGIAGRVRFMGDLPRRDLFEIELGADIVAVPSLYEGFGLAAAEAMALGAPVVASDAGGLPELIDDGVTGRLARAGSSDDLATAIRTVLLDKAAASEMSRVARAFVADHFAPRAVAAQTQAFYDQARLRARRKFRRTAKARWSPRGRR
jgi:glycosyltransferase involved in cell wall biosynthesis